MPEADEMYKALITLRNEAKDHHQDLRGMLSSGGLTAETMPAAMTDTASLLADLSTRLAEILSPDSLEAETGDEAEGDEEEDEEAEFEGGLEPEEAELLRRLLTDYRDMLKGTVPAIAADDPRLSDVTKNIADCERAIGIVNDLELVEVPEGEG